MTEDLFTPSDAAPHSASEPAAEAAPCPSAAFDACPVCSFDPCACEMLADPDPDVDPYPSIEAVAAIVAATPRAPAELLASWKSPALGASTAPAADDAPGIASVSSGAMQAFIDRRAALEAKHGAKAVTDRARPAAAMAHDLKERACALLDRLSGREPDADRAALALANLATLGALALALHERLSVYVEGARPRGGEEGGPEGSTHHESSGSQFPAASVAAAAR